MAQLFLVVTVLSDTCGTLWAVSTAFFSRLIGDIRVVVLCL